MLTKSTLFILGAGASVPYGFPSGRELIFRICQELGALNSGLTKILLELGHSASDLEEFRISLLRSNHPSVDIFIENNWKFERLGKDAIAAALIPCESEQLVVRRPNQMEWYEYFFSMLGGRWKEFISSKASIITFNYDRSLEYSLYMSLKYGYGASDREIRDAILNMPIVHFYGQLGKPDFVDPTGGRPYSTSLSAEIVRRAADEIKAIHEGAVITPAIERAHELLKDAYQVAFIGFGFHDVNIDRLNLPVFWAGPHNGKRDTMYGTGFKMKPREQKAAIDLLGGKLHLYEENTDALLFLRSCPIFA